MTPGEHALLTISEAAEVLRIHPRTLQRMIRDGVCPVPVVAITRHRSCIARSMLDRYIETGVPIPAVSA